MDLQRRLARECLHEREVRRFRRVLKQLVLQAAGFGARERYETDQDVAKLRDLVRLREVAGDDVNGGHWILDCRLPVDTKAVRKSPLTSPARGDDVAC